MRALETIPITAALLTSSNLTEPGPGEVVHAMATIYRRDEKVIIAAPASAVTISNGNPGVIGWTGHPLGSGAQVVFTTTGALPDGLTVGQTYYVLDPKTDSFTVSDIEDGAPIVTTSAGSGVHTATAFVHRVYESQKGTAATALISNATPAVVTVNEHGAQANTPVAFVTTGVLPAPLVAGTVYYVSATGLTLSTFQISTLVGGASIATTTAGSGVHTAIINPNVGKQPMRDDGAAWVDVGPTNAYALFDLLRTTKTYRPSPITFKITPGERIDSFALLGLIGDQVDWLFEQPGQPDISESISLSTRSTRLWSGYFFGAFKSRSSVVRMNIPPVTNGSLTLTVSRSVGQVGIGYALFGMQDYLGTSQFDAEADMLNFSKFNRDIFGNSELIRRRSVPKLSIDVFFDKANTNVIRSVLDRLNAVPALWVGIDDDTDDYFEAALVLGVYKRGTINLKQYNQGVLSLDLEGS